MKGGKIIIIVFAIIIGFAAVFSFWAIGVTNSAVDREEEIVAAKADVGVKVKARNNKLKTLADAITSSQKFEGDLVKAVADARKDVTDETLDISQLRTSIKAIFEAYPEIKTIELYQNYATEVSISENALMNARTAYNSLVRSYNAFFHKFPNKLFLAGVEKQTFELISFDEEEVAHLFNN